MTHKSPLRSKLYYRAIGAKNSIRSFFARLKYRWNGGYKCHCCSTLIPIHYHHIESEVNGERIIISNNSKHLYCAYCLGTKIESYFRYSEQLAPLHVNECDWMHRPAKTIRIIWGTDPIAKQLGLDVRFGGRWWNGHNACQEAFARALIHSEGSYMTSVWVHDKKSGKMKMIDRNGIKVGSDGSW
jgi:hypothetical protein